MQIYGLITLLMLGLTATSVPAQMYSVLYNLGNKTGDPVNPQNGETISQGRDGVLYSAATGGGASSKGAAFKVTSAKVLTVLNSFATLNCPSACGAWSGLILGKDGNFYGTSSLGGTSNLGTVFKITPSGILTIVHNFSGSDGATPYAAPTQGADGNFYGMTSSGGTSNNGTVYKTTPNGTFTTIYQFDGTHGSAPVASLIQGLDGNFYGATHTGGSGGNGVVFRVTTKGTLAVLYNFDGTHGSNPFAPLIQGSDGNFYGTANAGGTSNNGTVFKMTPTGKLTVLHNFTGSDGASPIGGLVQATDGNFYGSASSGGSNGHGTIYSVTPTGTFSVLHNFDGTDGDQADVSLLQHTNGTLYGQTYDGGSVGGGVFYSLNVGLGAFVGFLPQQSPGKVGASVGIFGQGFTGTTGVSFGGTPATFTVSSDTYLVATVPAGALTGSITAATPGGNLTSNRTFRVTPQITSFIPTSGPVGTGVTITGVSLTQATKVTFGGVAATTFTVNSDTQVTATVPTGAKTGKIVVTTAGGTATSSGTFTVTVACAAGTTVEQVFTSSVHGCAGTGAHSSASALCAPGWHVCSSAEWVAKFGGVTSPTHDYWVADILWFSNTQNANNNCAVALVGTSGYSSCGPPDGPSMLVCAGSQPDPEGNYCNITGCGLNKPTPIESFGGCPKTDTAGAACCTP